MVESKSKKHKRMVIRFFMADLRKESLHDISSEIFVAVTVGCIHPTTRRVATKTFATQRGMAATKSTTRRKRWKRRIWGFVSQGKIRRKPQRFLWIVKAILKTAVTRWQRKN
jgi:hypothetical protein